MTIFISLPLYIKTYWCWAIFVRVIYKRKRASGYETWCILYGYHVS